MIWRALGNDAPRPSRTVRHVRYELAAVTAKLKALREPSMLNADTLVRSIGRNA